jgi:hypothetical protein
LKGESVSATGVRELIVKDPSATKDFSPVGRLRPRTAPDRKDDQWMIGCEVLDRDFTRFSAYREWLPQLGIRTIRLQGGWAKCEKVKGTYDFAWLDECVDFALAHGLNPVLETDYGNPVYKGGGTPDLAGGFPVSEEALAAWDRWVDALSKHFKGRVRDWAMWNEPESTLQLWEFKRRGLPLFVFWTAAEWVQGKDNGWEKKYQRPGDSLEKRPVVFRWPGEPLKEPVWVDLLSGEVLSFPKSRIKACAEGVIFIDVPVYDSPCLLTERAAVDIVAE